MYGKIVGAALVAVALFACVLWSSSPIVAVTDAEGSAVMGGGGCGTGTGNGYQACGFTSQNPPQACADIPIYMQGPGTGWTIYYGNYTCSAGGVTCTTISAPIAKMPATCN